LNYNESRRRDLSLSPLDNLSQIGYYNGTPLKGVLRCPLY